MAKAQHTFDFGEKILWRRRNFDAPNTRWLLGVRLEFDGPAANGKPVQLSAPSQPAGSVNELN